MALIACPECTHQVSDTATACPHCGAPVQPESRAAGANLTTTQLTSKRFKMHTLLAVLAVLAGFVLMLARDPAAPIAEHSGQQAFAGVLILGGGLWYFITRVRIWWHHR